MLIRTRTKRWLFSWTFSILVNLFDLLRHYHKHVFFNFHYSTGLIGSVDNNCLWILNIWICLGLFTEILFEISQKAIFINNMRKCFNSTLIIIKKHIELSYVAIALAALPVLNIIIVVTPGSVFIPVFEICLSLTTSHIVHWRLLWI